MGINPYDNKSSFFKDVVPYLAFSLMIGGALIHKEFQDREKIETQQERIEELESKLAGVYDHMTLEPFTVVDDRYLLDRGGNMIWSERENCVRRSTSSGAGGIRETCVSKNEISLYQFTLEGRHVPKVDVTGNVEDLKTEYTRFKADQRMLKESGLME